MPGREMPADSEVPAGLIAACRAFGYMATAR